MASFPPFVEAMFDINLNSPLEQRQDKQEDSNICSYVHDHPSTEAFDLRRTFSLQIRFSTHGSRLPGQQATHERYGDTHLLSSNFTNRDRTFHN